MKDALEGPEDKGQGLELGYDRKGSAMSQGRDMRPGEVRKATQPGRGQ